MSELLAILVDETGLPASDLMKIIMTAPRRYKTFYIKKRAGGLREIAQPAREIKALQRILMRRILLNLPVHEAARAYRSGISIYDNAAPHRGHSPILKMDFENFFPSIRADDWIAYCASRNIMSEEDRLLSARIFFRQAKGDLHLKLSIGAPSSPAISNILLYEFDNMVSLEAGRRRISYTRYADDLTFSQQRIGMLRDMLKVVAGATKEIKSPKLKLHKDKTTFITAQRQRVVTGVVLGNSGEVGLGHERKRLISAKIHHASLGKLDDVQLRKLTGDLAFANVVEPLFIDRMIAKYGAEVISKIKSNVTKP